MGRTDNDTWDLASSVGATATMVAAARAMATNTDNPLIDDPFAAPLVRAVGIDFFTRLASGELRPEDLDGNDASIGIQRMVDNMAVRTKFFDDFFLGATGGGNPTGATGGGNPTGATGGGNPTGATGGGDSADATDAGIRQAVILASGLDARAYRLPWPAGTVVYEIDQPDVIRFKTRALAELGAQPTADRRAVPIDLRYDWPTALTEAGFDPSLPTAWSAEGLLGYLPPESQDRLLDTITALSAPGSRIATESAPIPAPADEEKMRERMQRVAERWRDHGFDLDLTELVYFGDRNEAAGYLADHGWQMSSSTIKELFAAHGLPPFDDDMGGFAELVYAIGVLPK